MEQQFLYITGQLNSRTMERVSNLKLATEKPSYVQPYIPEGGSRKKGLYNENPWDNLNINIRGYSKFMTLLTALMEFLQNCLDGAVLMNGNTIDGIEMTVLDNGNVYFHDDVYLYCKIECDRVAKTMVFENYGVNIQGFKDMLKVGSTSKRRNAHSIGQHGEGMKSAIAFLFKNKVDVSLRMMAKEAVGYTVIDKERDYYPPKWCDLKVDFLYGTKNHAADLGFKMTGYSFKPNKNFFRVTLNYQNAKPSIRRQLDNPIDWDSLVFFRNRFAAQDVIHIDGMGTIIVRQDYFKRIYNKRMYITSNSDLFFGYDFRSDYTNKERNTMPDDDISKALTPLLNAALLQNNSFFNMYMRILLDPTNAYGHKLECRVAQYLSTSVRTMIYQYYCQLEGNEGVQMVVPPGVETKHLGRNYRQVSRDLYKVMTRGIAGFPPYENIRQSAIHHVENGNYRPVDPILATPFENVCNLVYSTENIYMDFIFNGQTTVMLNGDYYNHIMETENPILEMLPILNSVGIRLTADDYRFIISHINRPVEDEDEEDSFIFSREEEKGEPKRKRNRAEPYREILLKGYFTLEEK